MVPAWLLRDVFPTRWLVVVLTVLPLACLCAEGSWRFVERPFLVGGARVSAPAPVGSVVVGSPP
jgi:peptidoglycan/LPS O-acetylase OafA/YrhL